MKKNISINIGGIIFHIEEDGYDRLKSYLDSINTYFSSFDDSKEIIDDIENRIAEILLQKLTDGKQVVIAEDIDELITTMGTVADFEATIDSDESEEEKQSEDTHDNEQKESSEKKEDPGSKRLYRDSKRRILGGVAAGMAHYFKIDPLWIRLIFLALLFNIFVWGFSSAIFIAYIILWIVLPANQELEDDKKVKKLYRNPDERVLGGVASGIASYFGTDITVIRLIFILLIIPGGAGLILYIVLWIITPEAKSITEKMQMQGEPVTLSNIEKNVKKSFNVKEGEENVFVKILLFPFRLIALIIKALGEILGPFAKFLTEAIRIVFGALVAFIGLVLMFSLVVSLAVILGIGSGWERYVVMGDLPIEFLTGLIDPLTSVTLFAVFFIPAIALVLVGMIVILKRGIGNTYVGWSLFGIWLVALAIISFRIPNLVEDFRVDVDYRKEISFTNPGGTPHLRLNEIDEFETDNVSLKLRGHSDSLFIADIRTEARGADDEVARRYAEGISYNILQEKNEFIFDQELDLAGTPYRFQEVDVIFYIPFEQPFTMDGDLGKILRNTIRRAGYSSYQMEDNTWIITKSGLECTTCEKSNRTYDYTDETSDNDEKFRSSPPETNEIDWTEASGESKVYEFEGFEEITATRLINIKILKGDEYRVELVGTERDLSDVYIRQYSDALEIEFKKDWNWMDNEDWQGDRVWVFITTPSLEMLELVGGCKAEISGFKNSDLELTATGGSYILADLITEDLDVNLTGASKINLSGSSVRLFAKIIGASSFEGIDFESEDATIQVLGASKAEVRASNKLDIDASGLSKVKYAGVEDPEINSEPTSTISKY